ncbi:MAG: hypothetical protein JW995_11265 [Melioribacteraceae bacterium]|nr:hypothetical protein [Melioribacteraceae bacterium]
MTRMKISAIIKSFVLIYLCLVVYSNVNIELQLFNDCGQISYNRISESRKELEKKYGAESISDRSKLHDREYQSKILGRNIIIDTSIIKIDYSNNHNYIDVELERTAKGSVYGRLLVDNELMELINSFNFREALMVAQIDRIQSESASYIVYSEEKKFVSSFGNDVMLSGICIDAVEIPAF